MAKREETKKKASAATIDAMHKLLMSVVSFFDQI